MSDRLVALALLAVCGFLYWQSTLIRRPPFAAFETFDAAAFPRAVIVVLALLCLALFVRGSGSVIPRVSRAGFERWLSRYRLPLMGLGLFALYALVMPQLGWNLSTAIYLVAMQLAILPRRGPRDLALIVGGSVAFTLVVGAGFERFLHVVLPRPDLF
jgi:hypothetical protein